jgi:hypothetical protein
MKRIMGVDFGFPKGRQARSKARGMHASRGRHTNRVGGLLRPRINKVRSMRFYATALGLLLAPPILYAQEPPQPPDTLRFLLVLPEDISPDGVQIQRATCFWACRNRDCCRLDQLPQTRAVPTSDQPARCELETQDAVSYSDPACERSRSAHQRRLQTHG